MMTKTISEIEEIIRQELQQEFTLCESDKPIAPILAKALEQYVIKARIEELQLFCAGINYKDFKRSVDRIDQLKKGLDHEGD